MKNALMILFSTLAFLGFYTKLISNTPNRSIAQAQPITASKKKTNHKYYVKSVKPLKPTKQAVVSRKIVSQQAASRRVAHQRVAPLRVVTRPTVSKHHDELLRLSKNKASFKKKKSLSRELDDSEIRVSENFLFRTEDDQDIDVILEP